MRPLRLGTRASALAMWQARTVAARLEALGAAVEIVTISTRGDARQAEPLAALSAEVGKGVFTKEIQEALLRQEIDLAVHSAKDMGALPSRGLAIGAVLEREDPRDTLVLPGAPAEAPFGPGLLHDEPVLGTGSPRRVAQLKRYLPRARFESIRGNVDTRLRKLDAGDVDALVLACAGLRRLGFTARISAPVPVEICVPAPGQGIIAVETRSDDEETLRHVGPLEDPAARTALTAEQTVVAVLGGGCQLPLGVFAQLHGGALHVRAVAASLSGDDVIMVERTGRAAAPGEVGQRLAEDLVSRGARELLRS